MTRPKKILFTLIALLFLICALEGAVRITCRAAGIVPFAASMPWIRPDGDLLYVLKPGFDGDFYAVHGRTNRFGMRGEETSKAKPEGTVRVLCLGDSRTFGYAVGQEACYAAHLSCILKERYPGATIEVLNAGVHGYTSYQGLRYFELQGLGFEPDIVTVAFEFNDRRLVPVPEEADGSSWFSSASHTLRWRYRLSNSYALLSLSMLLRKALGSESWQERVLALPSQRLMDLSCRVGEDGYRKNLIRIVNLCRERGIRPIFMTMADEPAVEHAYEKGMTLIKERRFEEAIEVFSHVHGQVTVPGGDEVIVPWFIYEIGLIHEAQGRTEEAQVDFRKSASIAAYPSAMGGYTIRPSRFYADVMEEVAGELDVPCVDLCRFSFDHPEFYRDICHFTEAGHRAIAEKIASCIDEQGMLQQGSPVD
ncbi:SGNH/GDSL hydrolase family protein [Acidobacteriota bacterium]